MMTAILFAMLCFAASSALSLKEQNNKLKAKLATNADIAPIAKPVATEVTKPVYTNRCSNVTPIETVTVKNDVTDIVSLFNYLRMRTDGLSVISEGTNPISEMDDFIKENMIDLRDQDGLICTDGRYLLQYGKKDSPEKFMLVEMKSPKMIQKFNYKYDQKLFEPYWDKIGMSFLSSMPSSTVINLIFDNCDYLFATDPQEDGIHHIPMARIKTIELDNDPINQIRHNINYPINQTIKKYINDVLVSARKDFGNNIEIFGVDKNNNYYIGLGRDDWNYLIPVDRYVEILNDPGNRVQIDERLQKIYTDIEDIKKKIANDTGYTIYDNVLGITFHKIEL